MKNTIITALLLISATITAKAQTKDFAGNWKLGERTSISGTDYANGVPTAINISLKGDSISIQRTDTGQEGKEVVSTETVSNDGKTKTHKGGKRTKTTSIIVTADKRSFTEATALSTEASAADIEFKISESYTLSADGKTLMLEKHFASTKNVDDQWVMKGEYNKE